MKVFLLTGLAMLGFLMIGAEATDIENQAGMNNFGLFIFGICLCKLQSLLSGKSDK